MSIDSSFWTRLSDQLQGKLGFIIVEGLLSWGISEILSRGLWCHHAAIALVREKLFLIVAIDPRLNTSHHVFLMIFKLRGPVKLCAAFVAFEFPILVVPPDMVLQVAFRDELLSTDFALIISLPIMTFKMNIKVTFLCKLIAAEITCVRLNTQMFSDMNLQARFLRVADPANWTLERLHFLMIQDMRLQMALSNEGLIAGRVIAPKRAICAMINVISVSILLNNNWPRWLRRRKLKRTATLPFKVLQVWISL